MEGGGESTAIMGLHGRRRINLNIAINRVVIGSCPPTGRIGGFAARPLKYSGGKRPSQRHRERCRARGSGPKEQAEAMQGSTRCFRRGGPANGASRRLDGLPGTRTSLPPGERCGPLLETRNFEGRAKAPNKGRTHLVSPSGNWAASPRRSPEFASTARSGN